MAPDIRQMSRHPIETVYMQLRAMLGQGSYLYDDVDESYEAVGSTAAPIKTIYIVGVVVGYVILVSLLIAMMSDR